ncbi:MAG TPA: hypothetical protein VEJ63_15070 [Planctomycetota bacterium]|nr:hypothetical protein [Planctomycetota bacterium]
MLTVTCPSCQTTLRNAAASSENKIRCTACGNHFNAPAAEAPVLVDSAAPDDGVAAPKPPLGPEPVAAGYGLLDAVAWAVLVFGIAVGVWQLYVVFAPGDIRGGALRPSPSILDILKTILDFVQLVLIGLALLAAAKCIARIDRRGAWLAWRSGALTSPVTEPEGSSLPYILPWTVSGGVLVMTGLWTTAQQDQLEPSSSAMFGEALLQGGIAIVGAGVVIFLAGLGCGEIRRFLWRVSRLGQVLPRRTRGDELSIGVPQKSWSGFEGHSSAGFILAALALLFVAYIMAVYQWWPSGSRVRVLENEKDPRLIFGGYAFAGFLFLVGGGYTMYLLCSEWNQTLRHWHQAMNSVGKPARPHFNQGMTVTFTRWSRIVGLAIAGLTIFVLLRMGSSLAFAGFGIVILSICGLFSTACLAWWLAALKRDSFAFVQNTSALSAGAVEGNPQARRAGKALVVVALVSLLVALANMAIQLFAVLSSFGTSPGALLEFIPMILLPIMALIALFVLPPLLLGMLVLDLDRAAANLESVKEVQA